MAFERLISPARECPTVVLRSVQAVEGSHGEGVVEEFLVAGEASVVGSHCMGTSVEHLGIGRTLPGDKSLFLFIVVPAPIPSRPQLY